MDNLHELDRKNIWHPFTPLVGENDPVLITRAEGIYLYSDDGRKIIDAVSSWWVNLHGHANSFIAEAVALQAKKLEHVIFAGFTHEPAILLSKNLLSILPQNQVKIFYSDNGSTAVEVALKMAFQFWYNQGVTNKKKVIAVRGAYHGDTFGSMAVGDRSAFTAAFSTYLFEVEYIDFPTPDNEEHVLKQFMDLVKNDDVGCFIYEPLVQAASGMRMYSSILLDSLLQVAQKNNIICIADEVFTGFCRTGKMFASDYLTNNPDIVAISKGITGGTVPLGVTSCNEKVLSVFRSSQTEKTFFHGHSYTANPIACAAANASFELLTNEKCQQQIRRIVEQHLAFKQKIEGHKIIQNVRNLGTILAIELKTQKGSSYFSEARKTIYSFFLERGILLRPLGNIVYVLPPYIIQEDQLLEIYHCIEAFLNISKIE
jgi:adenosylmethionine-8-amino-7-oxononanoate aminotransferase